MENFNDYTVKKSIWNGKMICAVIGIISMSLIMVAGMICMIVFGAFSGFGSSEKDGNVVAMNEPVLLISSCPESINSNNPSFTTDGIIVSDFAVKSGWFASETMLYMAFVAMANYSQPGYELGYAIKFMRMFMLFGISLFGIWGFAAGIILTLYLLLSTKIHGKKGYFSPIIPFSPKGFTKLLFRLK